MTDQRIAEITRIMNTVERTRAKLQSENQCYTCALGSHDECGDYCEKAADDYECEDEGCSNFKDGTPSYAKIDEDDLGTLFDYIPFLLSQLAEREKENERLRGAQGWIPVSERLPEAYIPVLVHRVHSYCDNDGYSDIRITARTNVINRCVADWMETGYAYIVTHWMPLPAAPEEGE